VGASFALVSRHTLARSSWWRAPALWALCIFQAGLVLPTCVYLVWQYPAWSLAYLLDPAQLPVPAVLGVVPPLCALSAFFAARWAIVADRALWAWLGLAMAILCCGVACWLGWGRFRWVGTYAAFRDHSLELRTLAYSPVIYLLAGCLPGLALGWGFSLWRLHLLDRAEAAPAPSQLASASLELMSAQLVSMARPAGTRKHET
jgi:hypothetical protein